MQKIIDALVYYGSYQSYLDPLGRPCLCVTCDQGQKAKEVLKEYDELEFPDLYPVDIVKAVLEFYATGCAYNIQSVAYGESGDLARYAISCIDPPQEELERAVEKYPWIIAEDLVRP